MKSCGISKTFHAYKMSHTGFFRTFVENHYICRLHEGSRAEDKEKQYKK